MKLIHKVYKRAHRKYKKLTTNRKTILILFDHFGVVGIDPLIQWQSVHNLSLAQVSHVHTICNRIDSGQIELDDFYSQLGQLIGKTGPQTKTEIASYAGYNRELLELIHQLQHLSYVRIGLVSNAHRSLHQSLWQDGIHSLFDDVVTSQEISKVRPKPDPQFFFHAINRLGGQAANTIFFDDRLINVEGAKAIGIKAHLFTTAQQCKVDLHKHHVFD